MYDDIVSVDDVNCKGKGVIDITVVFFITLRNLKLDMFVRQSNIQLTCYSYRRNCDKPRLRCSLLNCDYILQVLQQVATNDYKPNSRCITQIVKQGCASVHIVKQQTATFQTKGSWVSM